MEPIYRVIRREPGAAPVERVERPRLLTPAERDAARKEREKQRQTTGSRPPSSHARTAGDVTAQDGRSGVDYSA